MNNKILLLALAIPTLLTSFLNAEGLLGKRYFELGYQTGNFTSDSLEGDIDTWGIKTRLNIPLNTENQTFEYDFSLTLAHAEIDENNQDIEGTEVDFGLSIYTNSSHFQNISYKPFLSLSGGYADGSIQNNSDESFIYSVTAGVELPIDNFIVITPYIKYVDVVELDDGDDQVIGIDMSLWLNKRNSIGLQWEQIGNSGVTFNTYGFVYRLGF